MTDSLWPHGLQHARSLLSPRVCSNSCSLSWWWHPTIFIPLPSLSPLFSIFFSIRLSSNESALCIRWPKYWSFSFSIIPCKEHSGLISFAIDWFHLLAVVGTLRNLLSSTTIRKNQFFSAQVFFMIQLSHIYVTIGKIIDLTIRTFVSKVMSLLFNMLSRFVTAFLPRSKHLLISWLQSPSTVILEPKKRKFAIASTFSPSICYEVMGPDTMILVFWMVSFKSAFSLSSFTFIKRLFVKVTQSYLTLCDPMDYTVHGILQVRILEWVAFPFSRGSSQPRDQTQVSCIAGEFFTSWATREAQEALYFLPLEWHHLHIWSYWYFSQQS